MSKATWAVVKFETIRQLKKPAFWAAVLLMPVMMGVLLAISFFSSKSVADNGVSEDTRIAIIDEAGVLPKDSPFLIVGEKEDGIEKLKNDETDLYFYIPADFAEGHKVEFYQISEGLDLFNFNGNAIKNILGQQAAQRVDAVDAMVLSGGFVVDEHRLTANGESSNALGKAIIPLAILMVFFLYMVLFGGRLMMAVVEEKENRISEMILTTVSAKHLIVGKIIAMMTLGMIQILTFVIPALIIIYACRDNEMISGVLSMIEVDPVSIISNIVLFALSILLFTGLSTFVGVIVPTARDASQFIGPVIVGAVLPLYFMQMFLSGQVNFAVEFLTYFPFSAPVALMLRVAVGSLSPAGLCVGLIELAVLSVAVIWLTVRTFQKNAINFEVVKLSALLRK